MIAIKVSDLSMDLLSRLGTGAPVLLCENSHRVQRILKKSSFYPINLNVELAKKILDEESKGSEINVSFLVRTIIAQVDGPLLLTNFEMLFDPRYRLDIVRLFIDLSRLKPIAVDCSSYIKEGRLEYSNPSYEDHHTYQLEAYAVICVI